MVTFRVNDMTCGHCAGTISRAIAGVDKDATVEMRVAERLVRVSGTAAEGELRDAIRNAGYSPEVVDAAPAAAPRGAGGCCCSSKAAGVEDGQVAATARSSCCGQYRSPP